MLAGAPACGLPQQGPTVHDLNTALMCVGCHDTSMLLQLRDIAERLKEMHRSVSPEGVLLATNTVILIPCSPVG